VWATLGSGTSASNTSSATTTRNAGSSSAAKHDINVVLPAPGWPANTIDSRARTQARSKPATCGVSMLRSTSSASEANGMPV
jgi:hypothetical protein